MLKKSKGTNNSDIFKKISELKVDCVVVGGVANGVLIQDIDTNAQTIELTQPLYLKPLATSVQKQPEVAEAKDTYDIHWVELQNIAKQEKIPQVSLFGIAVVEGKTLTWAFSELVKGFIQNSAQLEIKEAH